MNNIQEKDWAEDSWSGHTGMDSFSDYSTADETADQEGKDMPEAGRERTGRSKQE